MVVVESTISNQTLVRIKAAAAALGIAPSTLRRYERDGILPKAATRNRVGQRVYTMHDLAAIHDVIVPPLKGADNDH